jgi:hypothetical protein
MACSRHGPFPSYIVQFLVEKFKNLNVFESTKLVLGGEDGRPPRTLGSVSIPNAITKRQPEQQ